MNRFRGGRQRRGVGRTSSNNMGCVCQRIAPTEDTPKDPTGQTICTSCKRIWPLDCRGCKQDWPFIGASWCKLCTKKRNLLRKPTPLCMGPSLPRTLPEDCFGTPGSRRWDVESEPPPGDANLGETMETYIQVYPDPRIAASYSEGNTGEAPQIGCLPQVVIRELIKYLPPMDVIRMANLLTNFREEVLSSQQAFDAMSCPCHTEIIGNQCWRHTKNRTNLFHTITDMNAPNAPTRPNARIQDQVQILRNRIDGLRPLLWGERRHYGGTESWRRRHDKPAGLHKAMMTGDTQKLASMFPAGDIESGIIHITVLQTGQRMVINNMGVLLLRIAGANITIHSIRMMGYMEQPLSDALSEMIWRQDGAACQICIEGPQQIRNIGRRWPPRWCTSNGARGRTWRFGLPPIPHLFHNNFIRGSLLGIEEELSSATFNETSGDMDPVRWKVVEPYITLSASETIKWRSNSRATSQSDNRATTEHCRAIQEARRLAKGTKITYDSRKRCIVKARDTPIPPMSKKMGHYRQPEAGWKYMDYYNPWESHPRPQFKAGKGRSKGEPTPSLLRAMRSARLSDIVLWEFFRSAAEWARFEERPAPAGVTGRMEPICRDLRQQLSSSEDSDEDNEKTLRRRATKRANMEQKEWSNPRKGQSSVMDQDKRATSPEEMALTRETVDALFEDSDTSVSAGSTEGTNTDEESQGQLGTGRYTPSPLPEQAHSCPVEDPFDGKGEQSEADQEREYERTLFQGFNESFFGLEPSTGCLLPYKGDDSETEPCSENEEIPSRTSSRESTDTEPEQGERRQSRIEKGEPSKIKREERIGHIKEEGESLDWTMNDIQENDPTDQRGEPSKKRECQMVLKTEPREMSPNQSFEKMWSAEERSRDEGTEDWVLSAEGTPIRVLRQGNRLSYHPNTAEPTQNERPDQLREGAARSPQQEQWSDPWSEPESPETMDYYARSDGVERNYHCFDYGPEPGRTRKRFRRSTNL